MPVKIGVSDCCGAMIVHHGIMIANVTRTQFPEGDQRRNIRNNGEYCAACGTPCLVSFADTVSNSPENFIESVPVTNPRRGPGVALHISAELAKSLLIDSVVDDIAAELKKRLARLVPDDVQYYYDTDTKKVFSKEA